MAAVLADVAHENSLRAAVQQFGSPSVPGKTPLEEVQILLAAGAEIEHALLVEYLYAFWSLANTAASDAVRVVAIQEMCHLITVQNLLLFTGALPFLERQDQDPNPLLDPFAFTLRPLVKDVLEEFLLAEMPPFDQMNDQQKSIMEPIIRAHVSSFHPVGVLYAQVFWLFQQNDQPDPAWPEVAQAGFTPHRHIDSFPGNITASTFQVDPDAEPEWHPGDSRGGIFRKVDSRNSALQTIADIAKQGEGWASSAGTPSHFATFLSIFSTTDLTQLPIVKMPTNPFVASGAAADPKIEANRITQKLAAALCQVFDIRYHILLATLRGALSRNRTVPADVPVRRQYASWALEEMRSCLRGLAKNIIRLPAKEEGTVAQLAAAPTFTPADGSLPDDPTVLDTLILDLHRLGKTAVTAALSEADTLTKLTLQSIQQIDKRRFPNLQ